MVQSGERNLVAENETLDGVAQNWQEPEDRLGDGIFVGPLAVDTLLRANVATNNGGDGIEVQSASTRLGDNRANGNGDFGIDAAAGVTDLGGNTASENGNPLQCPRNVYCS